MCKKYGFLAAGQNWKKWGRKLYVLEVGDLVTAYLKRYGYVGIGRVAQKACPVRDFKVKGKPLSEFDLIQPNIYKKNAFTKDCDHLIKIDWIKAVDQKSAKPKKAGIFTTPLVVASLANQPKTLEYLEQEFGVSFKKLLKKR